MDTKAQRAKYVELRTSNPSMRLRDTASLGPRKTINVKMTQRSSLEKPVEYFVELSQFRKDNPGREVQPSEIQWELIDGKWTEGVPWYIIPIPVYVFIFNFIEYNCDCIWILFA